MKITELLPLKANQIEEAATLAAKAFLHNPSYSYIFETLSNSNERLSALIWLFSRNFRLRLSSGRCAFNMESGEMVCFFMLQFPNAGDISTWQMIYSGLLMLPFLYGWTSFFRLIRTKEYHEKVDKSIRKRVGNKYAMLERMVVAPKYQGKGIGSTCLMIGLKEAESEGLGIILSTLEERSVSFYSKIGFQEIHRDTEYPFNNINDNTICVVMLQGGIKNEE
jgi:GNAT superfamily N-acetyltransferase